MAGGYDPAGHTWAPHWKSPDRWRRSTRKPQ